jgi:hypothetical protein
MPHLQALARHTDNMPRNRILEEKEACCLTTSPTLALPSLVRRMFALFKSCSFQNFQYSSLQNLICVLLRCQGRTGTLHIRHPIEPRTQLHQTERVKAPWVLAQRIRTRHMTRCTYQVYDIAPMEVRQTTCDIKGYLWAPART